MFKGKLLVCSNVYCQYVSTYTLTMLKGILSVCLKLHYHYV